MATDTCRNPELLYYSIEVVYTRNDQKSSQSTPIPFLTSFEKLDGILKSIKTENASQSVFRACQLVQQVSHPRCKPVTGQTCVCWE